MIESAENAIQLVLIFISTLMSFFWSGQNFKKAWALLGFSSFSFFLGDLYWQLYMFFYGETPVFCYISDISWYASYLFLILLMVEIGIRTDIGKRIKKLWPIPLFTLSAFFLYIQYGDIPGNVLNVILMTILIWYASAGLLSIREKKTDKKYKFLLLLILAYAACEYASGIISCFWMGDTILNPYFWFDFLLGVVFILLPVSMRKAAK